MAAAREQRRTEAALVDARAMLATGYSPAEVAARLEQHLEAEAARRTDRRSRLEQLTTERFGRVSR
jgi:hypothetical protein